MESPSLDLSVKEKSRLPEEELSYLRSRVRAKEEELGIPRSRFESDRIAKREISAYASTPAARVLQEAAILPEYEVLRQVLLLESKQADDQIDSLLKLMSVHGIRNVLSIVARLRQAHLERDFHQILTQCIAEGLPQKGVLPQRIKSYPDLTFFEIQPQDRQTKLPLLASASESLYRELLDIIDAHENYSLEIATPEGAKEASFYLTVPSGKRILAERLLKTIFPRASISERRGDYIFGDGGAVAGATANLSNHAAFPLKTCEHFGADPLQELLDTLGKVAKYGEGVSLQLVVGNEGGRYNAHYKKILSKIMKGNSILLSLKHPETDVGGAIYKLDRRLLAPIQENHAGEEGPHFREVAAAAIERKTRSRIVPATLRITVSARNEGRARQILDSLKAPFSHYDDPSGNRLIFSDVGNWNIEKHLREREARNINTSYMMPLSVGEIATMFHFLNR